MPAFAQQIQSCQEKLVRLGGDLQRKIDNIATGESKVKFSGPVDILTEDETLQLCRDCKKNLADFEKQIEILDGISKAIVDELEKQDLLEQIGQHRRYFESTQQSYRRAILLMDRRKNELRRRQLFNSSPSSSTAESSRQRQHGLNLQRKVAGTTEKLSSLVGQMGEQLSQSEATVGSLAHSSQNLGEAGKEFHSMGGTIETSSKLLSKYARRELTDKVLIALLFCLFFASCLYIIRKRMFPAGFFGVF